MVLRTGKYPFFQSLKEKKNVMEAVVLRDMRSRFFNHGLGFIVQCLWPLAHILIIMAINIAAGRAAPFGTPMLFFATGLIPTLTFIYISRFMGLSLVMNQQMLSFPIVKVTDILFGRAFLEVIAGCVTLAMIWGIFIAFGDYPYPNDPGDAVLAYMATILLALGVGTIVGVISQFLPMFATVYALMTIIIYISSGALFVTSSFPDQIAVPLSYFPIVQCVEWMRVSYFENYSDRLLSREYLVWFGATSLMLGLLLERLLRRVVMES
ncbi:MULTISPECIES: ABC transporter permease [unclassified Rhizobium]|uniref:ABC transporter permease n=1 Tax=unclassified Rhizobium TaxID=2613769 RepID=UPI0037FC35E8